MNLKTKSHEFSNYAVWKHHLYESHLFWHGAPLGRPYVGLCMRLAFTSAVFNAGKSTKSLSLSSSGLMFIVADRVGMWATRRAVVAASLDAERTPAREVTTRRRSKVTNEIRCQNPISRLSSATLDSVDVYGTYRLDVLLRSACNKVKPAHQRLARPDLRMNVTRHGFHSITYIVDPGKIKYTDTCR